MAPSNSSCARGSLFERNDEMNEYGWNDYWSTSPAENLCNQYEQLLIYMNSTMPSLNTKFSEVENQLIEGFQLSSNSLQECRGVIVDLFIQSLNNSKNEFDTILNEMDVAIQELNTKQVLISNRLETLRWYCKSEDNREKLYTYNQIKLD